MVVKNKLATKILDTRSIHERPISSIAQTNYLRLSQQMVVENIPQRTFCDGLTTNIFWLQIIILDHNYFVFVYIKRSKDKFVILSLYVDDILIA